MTTYTNPRTRIGRRWPTGTRAALAQRWQRVGTMVSAAAFRSRRVVLTIGALTCFDAAGWLHSPIIGLVVTGISLIVLDLVAE